MAQILSHSVPNKSRKLQFIPSQNEQDALSKLQLSWKDSTNSPPPYDGMQLMVKRPLIGSQVSPPTTGSAVPHKHRQHHKLPQAYLPRTSRRCPRKLNPATLLKYRPNTDLYSKKEKKMVKWDNCKHLCKYSVLYLHGKARVEINKRKYILKNRVLLQI